MMFLDKHGYPVERIKGRPFTNFVRLVLYTRKIKRGTYTDKDRAEATRGVLLDAVDKEK